MKTIDQHIVAMKGRHPGFALVGSDGRAAIWEGELAPFARTYRVRITYVTPILGTVFTIGHVQPRVQILAPLLERHADYDQGPIPHVYWDKDDPDHPILCLFNPDGGEWGLDDLIAETTVYWAARWLFFYEGWLATKKWHGGGHHLTPNGKHLATV